MISSQNKIKRIKIGQKKVVLIFEDGDKLEIKPNVYTEYNFYEGKILTNKDIKDIKRRNDNETYVSYALKLCSQRSYSRKQIEDKLLKKGALGSQIDEVIELLNKYQLIDEDSLVKEYLDYADYKHFGYKRIIEELKAKGISTNKLDKIKYDEIRDIKQAKALIKPYENKYAKYNYFETKKHISDALLRMGYSYDVINVALETMSPINEKKEKELLKLDYLKAKKKYENKYGPYETIDKINQYLMSKGYRYSDIKNLKE